MKTPRTLAHIADTEVLFESNNIPPHHNYEGMKRLRAVLVDWELIFDFKAIQRKRWNRYLKRRAEREREGSK
jgi:hypothetical protein